MTDTFETTLTRIIRQASDFQSRDERATEIAAVLPLLREVGWDTTNLSEIYPQHGLAGGGIVDYDLQIKGESRILIEVKRWGHDLHDEDESQLEVYCQSANPRPKLAVLTNGRIWRLYVAPAASRGKNSVLKKFDEVDVTAAEGKEVANTFNQFLSRKSMVDFRLTLDTAQDLHHKLRSYHEQKRSLTEAWNKLSNDKNALAKLLSEFAENKGITTNEENVLHFLESLDEPLVNEVTTTIKTSKKPASFAILASPTGKRKKTQTVEKQKGWNNFLLEICELMLSRHPENFRQNLLSLTDWFAEIQDSRFIIPVSNTGIYVKWGGSGEIRKACYEIVTKFDYPKDSLVIKDSKGAIL